MLALAVLMAGGPPGGNVNLAAAGALHYAARTSANGGCRIPFVGRSVTGWHSYTHRRALRFLMECQVAQLVERKGVIAPSFGNGTLYYIGRKQVFRVYED